MTKFALTNKQEKVLDYIVSFRNRNGFSPTTREIQQNFGFASQTAAINHLRALHKKGHVTSIPGRTRTIVPSN